MVGQENNNNVLRNRKNKRNKKTRSSSSSNENNNKENEQLQLDGKDQDQEEVLVEESLSDTFFKHPLIKVLKLLLIPYFIYNTMHFITLKHPEIINNVVSPLQLSYPLLRPSQQITDPKQVLIVGAEIADNKLIASSLHKIFNNYEIVHETFDTQHYFCRDGSVSWFQIMRFLKNQQQPLDSDSSKKHVMNTWKELCLDRSHSLIELFHPKQYDKGTNCSSFSYLPDIITTQKWSPCWAKQCLALVNSIWGCAWKKGEGEDEEEEEGSSCPNKFNKILHQVRHPLDSIDILNSTICSNNYPKLNDAFFNLIKGWFPNREWDDDDIPSSCTDAMGWYIIDFQSTLLHARHAGLIDGMFQIENTSPCDIVNMAGLLDEHTALYWDGRNSPKISDQCRGDNIMDNSNAAATSPDTFTRIKEENNNGMHHNNNDKKLKIEDFTSNSQLIKELKELISKLGYDNNDDDDNSNNNSEQSEFL